MLRLNNGGEGGVGLSIQTLIGIVIAAIGLFIFLLLLQTILSVFQGKDYCEDSIPYLNVLYNKINQVAESGKSEEHIFTVNPGCVLVVLNKYGNNLAEKPSYCFEKSCLCLCKYDKDSSLYNCQGAVCNVLDNIKEVKGDFSKSNLEDVFFLEALRDIKLGMATTQYNLNISKAQDGVYIKVIDSRRISKE